MAVQAPETYGIRTTKNRCPIHDYYWCLNHDTAIHDFTGNSRLSYFTIHDFTENS